MNEFSACKTAGINADCSVITHYLFVISYPNFKTVYCRQYLVYCIRPTAASALC